MVVINFSVSKIFGITKDINNQTYAAMSPLVIAGKIDDTIIMALRWKNFFNSEVT